MTRSRLAIDALFRAVMDAAVEADAPARAAACPPRPLPSPSPTPRPASLRLRVAADGSPLPSIDLGWTGTGHDQTIFAGTELVADLMCEVGSPRCDVRVPLADEPFAAPASLSVGGVSVCILFSGRDDAVGTFDTGSGDLDLALSLRMRTYVGTSVDQPCPACLTADGRPDVGEYGNCAGGPSSGGPCRVGGLDARLGAAGGTSNDCLPLPGALTAADDLAFRATTGTTTLGPTSGSPRCTGIGDQATCACDTCNNAAAEACASNADCPPSGGAPGICGGRRCLAGAAAGLPCAAHSSCPGGVCLRPGIPTRPNACSDEICTPIGDGGGLCAADLSFSICAEAPWRSCAANRDCPFGLCVSGGPPHCFPDVVERTGSAGPPTDGHAEATLVSTACLAPTGAASVNTVFGLPGPLALTLPVRVDFER